MKSTQSLTGSSAWFTGNCLVELRSSEARPPEEGEVRIKALYSAISPGTEMLVYRGEVPREMPVDATLPTLGGNFEYPVKYGYASVGEIIDVGARLEGFKEGDLVFAFNPHESVYTIPTAVVLKLPVELDPSIGVFIANIESAINIVLDAAPRFGESVFVIGQGVVGLLVTQLLRRAGAGIIATSELFEKRRALSESVGADLVIDPSSDDVPGQIRNVTEGRGADVVVEVCGRPTALDLAIEAAAPEGRVVVASWYGTKTAAVNLGGAFHRKRLTLKSSQVSNIDPALAPRWNIKRRRDLAISLLDKLSLTGLISHSIKFACVADAYKLIDEVPAEVVQVLLDYKAGSGDIDAKI